jgi:hypothetical protein
LYGLFELDFDEGAWPLIDKHGHRSAVS